MRFEATFNSGISNQGKVGDIVCCSVHEVFQSRSDVRAQHKQHAQLVEIEMAGNRNAKAAISQELLFRLCENIEIQPDKVCLPFVCF